MTGLAGVAEGDLAIDPQSGVLWGIQDESTGHALFQINTSTGAAGTEVIPTGATFEDLSALAFSSAGTPYLLDTTEDAGASGTHAVLYTINGSTGAVTSAVTLNSGLGPVAGMIFGPSGTLYLADGNADGIAGTNNLYTVNLSTGTLTLIGSTVSGGLSALTIVTPEPASAAMLAVMACGFAARRRSRA